MPTVALRYDVYTHTQAGAFFMSSTMTIRLEDDTRDRLEKLAKATQRSRSFLAAEAIRDYVALNEWQVGEIGKAMEEADRREFASDAEVKRFFDGWRQRAA